MIHGFDLLGFLERHLNVAILDVDFAIYTWSLNVLQDRVCILCGGKRVNVSTFPCS